MKWYVFSSLILNAILLPATIYLYFSLVLTERYQRDDEYVMYKTSVHLARLILKEWIGTSEKTIVERLKGYAKENPDAFFVDESVERQLSAEVGQDGESDGIARREIHLEDVEFIFEKGRLVNIERVNYRN